MATQDRRNREGKHQVVVRMPFSLHERLRSHVDANGSSVNAEICELVEQHLDKVDRKLKAAA